MQYCILPIIPWLILLTNYCLFTASQVQNSRYIINLSQAVGLGLLGNKGDGVAAVVVDAPDTDVVGIVGLIALP